MCHRHSACQLLLSCHNFSAGAAGHQKKEMDLTACQVALQNGEQQLHAEKAELAALVETLKVCTADQHLSFSVSAICALFVPVVQLQDYCRTAAVAIMFEWAFDSSFLLLGCHQLA